MMANAKKIALGLILLLGSGLALAEGKVAVLDLQKAVLSTDVAQQRLQSLEQNEEYAALRTRLESLTADVQAFQEDAQKNAMTWSDEQKQQKQEEMQSLRQEYQRAAQTLQGEQQRVMQAVMQEMGASTQEVLAQLIEAENIGLVLDAQAALHATSEYDITGKVTEMLNKANASDE